MGTQHTNTKIIRRGRKKTSMRTAKTKRAHGPPSRFTQGQLLPWGGAGPPLGPSAAPDHGSCSAFYASLQQLHRFYIYLFSWIFILEQFVFKTLWPPALQGPSVPMF